jgi:predicted nucleic acid-binding protein
MDRIVSNATPLIYLAKIDKLKLLKGIAHPVYIPEAVYKEVVVEGKRLGEKDAYRVEKCINQGWLQIKEVKNLFSFDFPLHKGELMDFDEFLSTLESIIHSGFYLKDEVYIKVIRKARQLAGE